MLFRFLMLCAVALIVGAGCGGGRGDNPVQGTLPDQGPQQSRMSGMESQSNRYLWGMWNVSIDPDSLAASATPARTVDFHLNAVKLLEVTACSNCLSFGNIKLIAPKELSVDVTLRHPYPGNLNLTAFDVRGVFITDADSSSLFNPQFSVGKTAPKLLNADGYWRAFYPGDNPNGPDLLKYFHGKYSNSDAMTADMNPFVAYSKDAPRRMFLPGTEETKTLLIYIPSWPFHFGYAVDACWANPGKTVTNPEVDFPPEANCNEAYEISVTVGEGLDEWEGSSAEVQVQVFDHQGPQTVQWCDLEAMDLSWSGFSLTSVVLGDGSVLFTGDLVNEHKASPGIYPLVVRVFDTEIDPNLHTDYAFQLCSFEVKPMQEHVPIAKAGAYPTLRTVGDSIEFYDDGSFDPDGGLITNYEWDWQNDGIYDAEGKDIYHAYGTPGDYQIQLRVTDDEGQTDTLDQPLQVTVKTGPGWARTWPAPKGWDVATDASGNVYVVGYWGGQIDFDPGPGVDTHFEPGDATSYLCKYDSTGIFQWARTWGAYGGIYPEVLTSQVAVAPDGSVLVCGSFNQTVDFDPGPGADIHSCQYYDAYVSKFTSDGSFQWVRTWGGDDWDGAIAVAVDSEGKIYVGGYFAQSVDLDPGLGSDVHVSKGGWDAFLMELDADGNFGWGRSWGADSDDECFAVSPACPGHVFAVGPFSGTCDFDPGAGEEIHQSNGNDYDAYLSAFDPAGDFLWVRTWGGSKFDVACSVAASAGGDVYVAGTFADTVDFDPGPGVDEHASAGYGDAFLSKFSSEGDFAWAGTWGSSGGSYLYPLTEDAREVAIDEYGNVFVAGRFEGTADFDPGPGVEEHSSAGQYDAYLSKFDPQCNFEWARVWGGAEDPLFDGEFAYGLAVAPSGDAYVTGCYSQTCDFDPGPGEDLHSCDAFEAYLTKFGPNGDW